jgi:hypothetical protein
MPRAAPPAMRMAIATVLIVLWSGASNAQVASITGLVTDARTGRPLAGVLVSVEGQTLAVETDAEGRFRLGVPPGRSVLTISLVGYAVVRHPLDVTDGNASTLSIQLSEGAGAYAEHVRVSGAQVSDSEGVPGGASLHGRELQALRGVTLDDPLRAMHALPSVTATDDFYSEFAVRGSPFRHVGLSVDGIPSRYLMHSVHGVTDGGSIAMINSDAVGSLSLMPGSYPQRTGRRLGAQVDLGTRDGNRDAFRARAGLSGTSASVLVEGPLGDARGSWLVSARRSYLDLLLERIDAEGSFGFGFTDAQAKVVFDVTPRNQLQVLVIAGASAFDEEPQGLSVNDEAEVNGRSWLSGVTWLFTPSSRFVLTQRLYATGLAYENRNRTASLLDDSLTADVGWRADASVAVTPGLLLELGADALHLTGRHTQRRSLNDATELNVVSDYRSSGRAASGYAQAVIRPFRRLSVTPGARVDHWGPTGASTTSPWATTAFTIASGTRIRAGAGVYRQFADFEQIDGIRGGGTALRPERARHVDVGVSQAMPCDVTLEVTWFAREERDVLWTPGAEPRRLADGSVQLGRGDAPWINTLDGTARGVEIVMRRDASAGLSGWAGYAYGRHRYTDVAGGEPFWSDHDQRHSLSLFGYYRVSRRTTVGAKFRYGSNYPLTGYIGEQPFAPDAPPLFGGGRPLFYGLIESRNTLRLPAYARLDLRADRTFTWSGRRVTLFGEVANALNRQNLRNVPYGVDRAGRVSGPTDTLLPIVPSAGFVIEF